MMCVSWSYRIIWPPKQSKRSCITSHLNKSHPSKSSPRGSRTYLLFKSNFSLFFFTESHSLKVKHLLFRITKLLSNFSWLSVFTTTLSHCLDLFKDSMVLIQISISQGRIQSLMNQPQPYMKGVRPLLHLLIAMIIFNKNSRFSSCF